MSIQKMMVADLEKAKAVEMKPGIVRRTLVYNDEVMVCHFALTQGATIDLHQHAVVQSGYVLKGKLQMIRGDGTRFTVAAGTAYVFDANEVHGVEVCETAEVIECFAPMRPEYI